MNPDDRVVEATVYGIANSFLQDPPHPPPTTASFFSDNPSPYMIIAQTTLDHANEVDGISDRDIAVMACRLLLVEIVRTRKYPRRYIEDLLDEISNRDDGPILRLPREDDEK